MIDEKMGDTKRKLMENFDDEVRNRLRLREEEARSLRSVHEKSLYYLTKHLLGSLARFDDPTWTFEYQGCRYGFDAAQPGIDHLYRPGLPLAQQMLMSARGLCTPEALLEFQYDGTDHIGVVSSLAGKRGFLTASLLRIASEETLDEVLLLACILEDGSIVESESAMKLFRAAAVVVPGPLPAFPLELDLQAERLRQEAMAAGQTKARQWLEQEIDKLDSWADDLKAGLDLQIKELDAKIRQLKKAKAFAASLDDKLSREREYKALEKERSSLRRRLFDAQDEIDAKRDGIIGSIENRLKAHEEIETLFRIGFSVTNGVDSNMSLV